MAVGFLSALAAVVLLYGAVSTTSAQTTFQLSNTLGSNMVLQRAPVQAVIWGYAAAGDTITVQMSPGGFKGAAQPDSSGLWTVKLPATEASPGPYTVTATSAKENANAVLSNVAFGDVYLCSGQSNMQFTVHQAFNASSEIAMADEYTNIRVMTVGQKTRSDTPLTQLGNIEQVWSVASNDSVGHGDWTYLSAVCWLFGRDLYNNLKVPIGLVSTNWGGTPVQFWSSADALAKCNQHSDIEGPVMDDLNSLDSDYFEHIHFNEKTSAAGGGVLYNAMIAPFLPMRVRGAIWYQGESNVGTGAQKGKDYYACQFSAMISDWREKFDIEDMYFGFVQLAAYPAGHNDLLADLRQGQLAALKLPKVGMATAVDLGDLASPFGAIHPRNKQTVSVRLAATALALEYQQTVVYQGPMAQSAKVVQFSKLSSTLASVQVQVTFVPGTTGSGLVMQEATCPQKLQSAPYCTGFEVLSSADNKWYPATGKISDNTVIVSATMSFDSSVKAEASAVMAVGYAYSDWPLITLYNVEKFPAIPFCLNITSSVP